MNYSNEWELCYKEGRQISIWPFSDLVSYVMRYANPEVPDFRVLELGCGAGANIPFFKSLGVEYFSIEGSSFIVRKLIAKYPELKDKIILGDFTEGIPFRTDFDLVVDRSSLSHNSTVAIKQCLNNVCKKLKQNGKFIGVDWFSTHHSGYQKGEKSADIYTRKGYKKDYFVNVGLVHFSDKLHLYDLFKDFEIEVLEHKIIQQEVPDKNKCLAFWDFVAKKKGFSKV